MVAKVLPVAKVFGSVILFFTICDISEFAFDV